MKVLDAAFFFPHGLQSNMLKSCPHGRCVILSISKTVYLKESISSSVGVIRDKFKFWSALEKNRF